MKDFDAKEISTFQNLEKAIKASKLNYDLVKIHKAYEYAFSKHHDNARISGAPIMRHCLSVAGYVTNLRLDTNAVCAALLHDVIEHSTGTVEEIEANFGIEVAFIVDGLTQIRRISGTVDVNNVDSQELTKLIFTACEDIRIIIIRIAEKLHNILTIDTLDGPIKNNAAMKIKNVYAPLAEYLGLGSVQRIMEDKAFEILHPQEYHLIKKEISAYLSKNKHHIEYFERDLRNLLERYNLTNFELYARQKGIYSAYEKLKRKYMKDGLPFEKAIKMLLDIYAARVIVDTVEQCYMVLGLVNANYETIREEFVDYIANPKDNGYKSIHILFKFENTIFEVQIRTKEMHEFNEYGPASHIAYKLMQNKVGQELTWTKELTGWKDKLELSQEDFQIKAFRDSIFVFTPKGKVIRLPQDASPLDFAFHVHTQLGTHYRGALVNKKMVSMQHELKTGDVVEVLTSKNLTVTSDWLKFAKSKTSQSHIRKALRVKDS